MNNNLMTHVVRPAHEKPRASVSGVSAASLPLERLRNIGIIAHIDAGKTTLSERMLLYAGAIHRAGDVHHGDTTLDFDPIEQRKGITINSAAIACSWQPVVGGRRGEKHRVQLIDTPGHVDFTAEVERSLRVLDGAVAVFSAVEGVQPQSERVWRQANHYGVPRIAFINKMDRMGADFNRVVADMRKRLGANAWPVALPIGSEADLRGQVDLVTMNAVLYGPDVAVGSEEPWVIADIPAEMQQTAREARTQLVAALAEIDDAMAEAFLAEQDPSAEELRAALRRQTIAGRIVPVIAGSAFKYVGVHLLLDAVVDYLPNPLERQHNQLSQHENEAHKGEPEADPSAPLRALVFKVAWDDAGRRRAFVRIYSGTLRPGDKVENSTLDTVERVERVLEVRADHEVPLTQCGPGDIVALTGLRRSSTGHTLCTVGSPIMLEPPTFPDPVVSMAIEPKTRTDADKLSMALSRLADADPTFRITSDAETGQTLIAGMGELHLEVLLERLATDHGVNTTAGAPSIAYRETITRPAEGEGKYIHQNGGKGMHGHAIINIAPSESGSGVVVEDRVTGGAIPRQFINSVRKGIVEAAKGGVLAGYPLTDITVQIVDGSYHDTDSNEMAFYQAGSLALKDAARAAGLRLLEPVMAVECTVPDDRQGDVQGDLQRRRGRVLSVTPTAAPGYIALQAEVPLSEMFGYAGAIRSLTRGRGEFSMQPTSFEPVPESIARKVITQS
ncbi:MAG: elongation factor G [Candidatus Methylacidiphilales bacterium]